MRVLQAPLEIAGQVGLTAFGLREVGHAAHTFFPSHSFRYALPADFYPQSSNRWLRRLEIARMLVGFAARYDVFHFHFGRSFLPDAYGYMDARMLRTLGRRVCVEFWGSDIRLPTLERQRNPYFVNAYGEDDDVNRRRMQRWAEITGGHVIISDHYFDVFLRPYFPQIHVVAHRVDTRRFPPRYPDPEHHVPVVVHAPSHKGFKGTEHVQRAVDRLRAKGLRFEYREVFGLSQAEALAVYSQADLIVDQLCAGAYGVFAVEAMSLGKPVIGYILPELVPTYPVGMPLINANPDTIEAVLAEWIERAEDRYSVGVQGRAYAERVHDCRVVAKRLAEIYRGLSGDRGSR